MKICFQASSLCPQPTSQVIFLNHLILFRNMIRFDKYQLHLVLLHNMIKFDKYELHLILFRNRFRFDKYQLHVILFYNMIRFYKYQSDFEIWFYFTTWSDLKNANHFVSNWTKYRPPFRSILRLHNLFKGSTGVGGNYSRQSFHTFLFQHIPGPQDVLSEISFYARHLSFAILKFHIHFTALCRLICQRGRAEHRTNTFIRTLE